MTEISRLTFPAHWKAQYVRPSGMAEMEAKVAEKRLWRDDDDHDLYWNWLDDNAPGWTLAMRRIGLKDVEMPVGREPVVSMVECEIDVVFLSPDQRDAWRSWTAALNAQWDAERARIDKAVNEAPDGVEVCRMCGEAMEEERATETSRLAQFAFRYSFDRWNCKGCGSSMSALSVCDHLIEAYDMIDWQIGLPQRGSPHFTDAVQDEWDRRRQAPPQVTVEIEAGMSAADIVAALDVQLPPRLTGPRLVEG